MLARFNSNSRIKTKRKKDTQPSLGTACQSLGQVTVDWIFFQRIRFLFLNSITNADNMVRRKRGSFVMKNKPRMRKFIVPFVQLKSGRT